jgi:hypothetical protein
MSILNKLSIFFLIFCSTCLFAGMYDAEVRVGLNHYTDSLINQIYGKANFDVELESHYQKNSRLSCFGNLSFTYQTGYTEYFDDKTKVKNLSLSLGPRFLFPISSHPNLIPYLGIGFTGSWVHTHDFGENVIAIINKGAFGPCFKSGFMWERSKFYIDVFFDYYILYPKNSENDYTNFSQLKSGVGLGRKF